jgi:hypothetical protein
MSRRDELSSLLAALADEIDAACERHRKAFPDGAWKDVNDTLGALNRVAMDYLHPQDWHKGNARTAALLREHAAREGKTDG